MVVWRVLKATAVRTEKMGLVLGLCPWGSHISPWQHTDAWALKSPLQNGAVQESVQTESASWVGQTHFQRPPKDSCLTQHVVR